MSAFLHLDYNVRKQKVIKVLARKICHGFFTGAKVFLYDTGKLALACILVFVLLIGAGCTTNPVTGVSQVQLISEAMEIQLGKSMYFQAQQSQGGVYVAHPDVVDYVCSIAEKLFLVSDREYLPFEIVVLNNIEPNAWALPGGKLAINSGLLMELESEAELAAVLAHEIVHVAARHGAQSVEKGTLLEVGIFGLSAALGDEDHSDIIMGATTLSARLLNMKYSRDHEREADKYGIKYMAMVGYAPHASVKLQETFLQLSDSKNPNWITGLLATHPPSRDRIIANRKTVSKYPNEGFVGRDEYQKAIMPLLKAKKAYLAMADGYQALSDGDTLLASKLAEKAIGIDPEEAHFHALAAKTYIENAHWEKALKSINQAIFLNEVYYEYFLLRGWIMYERGSMKDAYKDLRKSVSLLPTARGHYFLGMISFDKGNMEKAIVNFQIVTKFNSPYGEKALVMLTRIKGKEGF